VRMRKTSHLSFPAKAGTHGAVVSNFFSHRIAHKRDRSVQWNDAPRLPPGKHFGEPCRISSHARIPGTNVIVLNRLPRGADRPDRAGPAERKERPTGKRGE
jgi:hypothetical protein